MNDSHRSEDSAQSIDERLSADLGFDVASVEAQIRFRLDLASMQRGEIGQLGYVVIERSGEPDAVVVFASVADAQRADHHPLVQELAGDDLRTRVLTAPGIEDLASREIFIV